MKKRHQYLILLVIILLFIVNINDIVTDVKFENDNIVINKGKTLSERFVNISNTVILGSGLYKQENKYVFKGNPDNYIKFNDELWRIVSLEEDGTIKIVRNDLLNLEKKYTEAIDFLNNEYYNSLKNKNFIVEHDYDITTYDIGRLTTKEDLNNLICNQKQKYYVGMLSVVEIANATTNVLFDQYLNAYFWVNRNYNYLYLSKKWLTMTPSIYINLDFFKENDVTAMLRPSVYLDKNLKITCGKGTKSNPYILDDKSSYTFGD